MVQFTPQQRVYLASILGYMQQSPLAVREPGWEEQGYWGKPFSLANPFQALPIPTWQTVTRTAFVPRYTTRLQEYIAAPVNAPALANVNFRLRVNERVLTDMSFTPGLNRHHAPTFPLVRQSADVVTNIGEIIFLECLNLTGATVLVAGGLFGWYYYNPDDEVASPDDPGVDVTAMSQIKSMELFDG
jgi:hypothetical protein